MNAEVVKRTAYILRTCRADMTSHRGFAWPREGHVAAADWRADDKCGGGLHGLLAGEGDGGLANWRPAAVWLVARVEEYVDLGGKVKAPEAWVLFAGGRKDATDYLQSLGCSGAVIGSYKTGGGHSTLTGGYGSTLTGGYGSTLTGGYRSTLTGGDRSTLTGGDESTLTGGDRSSLTGGGHSTLTGGYHSTLTGGYGSTLTGGDHSTLTFMRWDGLRRRAVTIYPGEDCIEPGVAYRLDGDGKPVRAEGRA